MKNDFVLENLACFDQSYASRKASKAAGKLRGALGVSKGFVTGSRGRR